MSDSDIIQINGLTKKFGKVTAVDNVTTSIGAGRIVGLLGANGAGKSTLLRHIIGFYLPTSGSCSVFGVPSGNLAPKELSRIGYVHQNGELIEWMKVRKLIRYVSAYYDHWNEKIEKRFIGEFELDLDKRVGSLSPGQKQRLAILLAICFEPELLILDEPASGLDPIARMQFLDLLLEIIQDSTRTIIISSHILSDVEKIIDHVIVMKNGTLLRDCSFDLLQEEYCRIEIILNFKDSLDDIALKSKAIDYKSDNSIINAVIKSQDAEAFVATAEAKSALVKIKPLNLEQIFKIIAR